MQNTADLRDLMKKLTLSQLDEIAAREVFKEYGCEKIGFDMKAFKTGDAGEMSKNIHGQIMTVLSDHL